MADTPIFTFQDMCEFLWNSFNPSTKPPTGRELRLAKSAIVSAYRDLAQRHPWLYYHRRTIVSTEASYSTGTITYDHTGGASERLVTLASGTWPTNAARGVIKISGVHYPVTERLSDSTVTLDVNANPGADVSSGTSYLWYRESYQLPTLFRRMGCLVESTDGGNTYPLDYVDPHSQTFIARTSGGTTTNRPEWYTIRNDGDYIGSLSLIFGRPPSAAKSYDMIYETAPRPLATYKESAGTVSVSAGATTVSGSGTAFASTMIGAIIRFSTTSVLPTDVVGMVDGTLNPYFAQRTVMTVASTTSLTIDSAVSDSDSISGKAYAISDPIDIEPHVMRGAFESLAMAHYSRLAKRADKDAFRIREHAEREVLQAMDADRRSVQVQVGQGSPGGGSWSDAWGTVSSTP